MLQLLRSVAVVAALVYSAGTVQACDICGCAGGNSSMGLLPLLQRHFIGARWQQQAFATVPHGSGQTSVERFSTIDLWGRWQPHRRIQLIGVLPYASNRREYADGSFLSANGIGDLSLSAHYSLLDPRKQGVRPWAHTLQVGLGVQLPTGDASRTDEESQLLHANLQPGTGITAPFVGVMYALRRGQWGSSVEATFRKGGENDAAYTFGHRMSAQWRVFRKITAGAVTFLPQTGLMADVRQKDRDDGSLLAESGGKGLFATAGADMMFRSFMLGVTAQLPVYNHFAKGYVTPRPRLQCTATVLIGREKRSVHLQKPPVSPSNSSD